MSSIVVIFVAGWAYLVGMMWFFDIAVLSRFEGVSSCVDTGTSIMLWLLPILTFIFFCVVWCIIDAIFVDSVLKQWIYKHRKSIDKLGINYANFDTDLCNDRVKHLNEYNEVISTTVAEQSLIKNRLLSEKTLIEEDKDLKSQCLCEYLNVEISKFKNKATILSNGINNLDALIKDNTEVISRIEFIKKKFENLKDSMDIYFTYIVLVFLYFMVTCFVSIWIYGGAAVISGPKFEKKATYPILFFDIYGWFFVIGIGLLAVAIFFINNKKNKILSKIFKIHGRTVKACGTKIPMRKFKTKKDAFEAYKRGEIEINDSIDIKEN